MPREATVSEVRPVVARIERIDAPPPDPLGPVREALARGDAAGALRVLQSEAPSAATATESRALTAAAHQQLGQHAEAIAAYREALHNEPDIGAWWAGLGLSLEAAGQGADALAAYREAERRGPLDPALSDYLGVRVEALSTADPSR
jgi:tetratricopeptide (TPR) repeat protein